MRIIIPQDRETPVQELLSENFKCRFAYSRSADTKQHNDVGQDYIALNIDSDLVIFALCDGVSQSFYGDLAARLLGDALLDWFAGELSTTPDLEEIAKALEIYLKGLIQTAKPIIKSHPTPPNASPLLKSVLEDKRDIGSETTFIGGCIQLPSQALPQGRAVFAWMGDSRLRLWGKDGELTDRLGNTFLTSQRWSTKRGMVGSEVHLYQSPIIGIESLTRIVAYSDGLASFDDIGDIVTNSRVKELIDEANEGATSDDISFLEIILSLDGSLSDSPRDMETSTQKPTSEIINLNVSKPLITEIPIEKSAPPASPVIVLEPANPTGKPSKRKKRLLPTFSLAFIRMPKFINREPKVRNEKLPKKRKKKR